MGLICLDCFGVGMVCNLCWQTEDKCECPKDLPKCRYCGKYKHVCEKLGCKE